MEQVAGSAVILTVMIVFALVAIILVGPAVADALTFRLP